MLKPDNHRSAIQAGAIPSLVSILSSPGSVVPEEPKAAEVGQLAASILRELARSHAVDVVSAPGVVPALIGAMWASGGPVALAEQAAGALQALFMSPDLRATSAGSVRSIGSTGSAGSVADPRWSEWAAGLTMLSDYVAGAVVSLLASSCSPAQQRCALGVLGSLAASGGGGSATANQPTAAAAAAATAAAIPLVIALLGSDTASVREHAAAAIAALAWDTSNQACAAKAGAIPRLVELLKSPPLVEAGEPRATSSTQQDGESTSPSKHQLGAAPPPPSRQQELAAGALSAVVWHHAANQAEAVAAGALPLLVALLSDAHISEAVKEQAAGSLWSLTVGNASVKAVVEATAGAVAALRQLAGDGACSAALRANATGALTCLGRH